MKTFQKVICLFGLFVFFLTCLFPPWQQTFDKNGAGGGHNKKPAGYEFILEPPSAPSGPFYGVQIDFQRLVVGWLALGVAVAGFLLMSRLTKLALPRGSKANVSPAINALSTSQISEPQKEKPIEFLKFRIGGCLGSSYQIISTRGQIQHEYADWFKWESPITIVADPIRWEQFWREIETTGVWQWNGSYVPHNADVLDGTQWSLEMDHKGRYVIADGNNAYPGCKGTEYSLESGFGKFLAALNKLTGLKMA